MITCLAEHGREQRIVAPLTLVAHRIEREDVLEDEAREVPGAHYVGIFHQSTLLLELLLAWRCRHAVAILCRVVAIVALAYDENYVGRAERTRIHARLVDPRYKAVNLLCGKRIGIKAEHQSVNRLIKVGWSLLGERMFYIADCTARHQLDKCSLVVGA